ncbi:hypothetical protein HPB50_017048 [Hyalomma asiaticum]|uniref:Uncharacterized protein n=1 Tax=Hyalomma asiaticum TaxID=266040 RepID=A0ACB7TIT6_HYAAI|nr:hypothetical protein HPB50_017048 [Hyalomma asiaticum]
MTLFPKNQPRHRGGQSCCTCTPVSSFPARPRDLHTYPDLLHGAQAEEASGRLRQASSSRTSIDSPDFADLETARLRLRHLCRSRPVILAVNEAGAPRARTRKAKRHQEDYDRLRPLVPGHRRRPHVLQKARPSTWSGTWTREVALELPNNVRTYPALAKTPCDRGRAFVVFVMNALPAVRLRPCACRLGQACSQRHLRDTRMLSDGGLSSSDALSGTEDPEEQLGDNPGATDPTNILTALDLILTKHCGAEHCTSVFGVADGWRARVSVAWPKSCRSTQSPSQRKNWS